MFGSDGTRRLTGHAMTLLWRHKTKQARNALRNRIKSARNNMALSLWWRRPLRTGAVSGPVVLKQGTLVRGVTPPHPRNRVVCMNVLLGLQQYIYCCISMYCCISRSDHHLLLRKMKKARENETKLETKKAGTSSLHDRQPRGNARTCTHPLSSCGQQHSKVSVSTTCMLPLCLYTTLTYELQTSPVPERTPAAPAER